MGVQGEGGGKLSRPGAAGAADPITCDT